MNNKKTNMMNKRSNQASQRSGTQRNTSYQGRGDNNSRGNNSFYGGGYKNRYETGSNQRGQNQRFGDQRYKSSFKPNRPKPAIKPQSKERTPVLQNIKLFNIWDSNIAIIDPGLKDYINLTPILVPKTQGRNVTTQFWKNKMHIVERLMNKLMVVGHKGKSHKFTSGHNVGKTELMVRIVKEAFQKIEKKLGKNPVEVLVKAVENSAPREEITTIEYGGARYPKAVECSPQRRVDLALRNIASGTYSKSFTKKKKASDALAEELFNAYQMNNASNAIAKKFELERQADSSR